MIVVDRPFLNVDVDLDTNLYEQVREKIGGKKSFSDEDRVEFEAPLKLKLNFGGIEGDVHQNHISLRDARNIISALLQVMSELGDPVAVALNDELSKIA